MNRWRVRNGCGLDRIDGVVTDPEIPAEQRDALEAAGVVVRRV